mgnify:FL=1
MEGTLYRSFNDPLSNNDIVIIPVDSKTTVMAVDQGTVVGISDHNDGTVTVALQHSGGYISVYGNLSELLVRRGQRVSSGSVIGSVGGSNDENITHSSELYFELWRDGTAVDPERYILF